MKSVVVYGLFDTFRYKGHNGISKTMFNLIINPLSLEMDV